MNPQLQTESASNTIPIPGHLLRYMRLARLTSQKSLASDHAFRVGCVIIKRRRIIGVGCNTPTKTHPKCQNRFKKPHAEDAAIRACTEDTRGAIAFVYREFKDGTQALSRPCRYCIEALREAGIKVVFYTTSDGPIGEIVG